MTRYQLLIEYDGHGFVGWQRQDNGLGVQQVLEDAVSAFSGEAVVVQGAGRTDAGVHALGQVAHLDLAKEWPADTVRDAMNAHMKTHAVSVLTARVAVPDFHARFSAIRRAYRYCIVNRRAPLCIAQGHAWWVPSLLDSDAMAKAAGVLIGHHDFTTFRASECQANSPEKTLDELTVRRCGEDIEIIAQARSFLHHQVRNMVGSLAWVGEGKWTSDDMRRALAAKDRRAGGPTAPADGLFLVSVGYGDDNE